MLTSEGELTPQARQGGVGLLPPPSPQLALQLAEDHLGVRPSSVAEALRVLRPLTDESRRLLCQG